MPVSVFVLVAAGLVLQDPWPPAERGFGKEGFSTATLKSEQAEVPDPADPSKKISVTLHTYVTIIPDPDAAPISDPEVANTVHLNQNHQKETVVLTGEAWVRGGDGLNFTLHGELGDRGIAAPPVLKRITEHITAVNEMLRGQFDKPVQFEVTWNPHANNDPDTLVAHDVGHRVYEVGAQVKVVRVYEHNGTRWTLDQKVIETGATFYYKQPVDSPLDTRVTKAERPCPGEKKVGALTIPWGNYAAGIFTKDKSFALVDYNPTPNANPIEFWRGAMTMRYGNEFDPVEKIQSLWRAQSMNRLRVTGFVQWEYNPGHAYFPAGTLLVPEDDEFQVLMFGDNCLDCWEDDFDGLSASIQDQPEPLDVFILCANMAKKEPNETIKYYPAAPPNSIYTGLGKLSAKSFLKGPVDQARLWIYTDNAGYNDILRRVGMGFSPRMYAMALYDVAKIGGLDPADLANPKMFDSELLSATDLTDAQAEWIYRQLAFRFPANAAAELASPRASLKRIIQPPTEAEKAKPESKEKHFASIAKMTNFMLSNGSPEVRSATWKFLMTAVPDDSVSWIAKHNPIPKGAEFAPKDDAEATLITQVKARYSK